MIFHDAQRRFPAVVKDGNLHLNVRVGRDVLTQEFIDCLGKLLLCYRVAVHNIVDVVILDRPVRADMVIREGGVEDGSLFKETENDRFQQVKVDFKIVVKLGVHHPVVVIAEKIVHLIP